MARFRGMVFAAGLGTRLRPLTLEVAKPAVRVGNRPLVSYSLEHLQAAGAEEACVNLHYLPDTVRAAVKECEHKPEVRFSEEPVLLGTAGGLRQGLTTLRGVEPPTRGAKPDRLPILIMNGDILFSPDLTELVAHHEASGAHATMVVRRDPLVEKFGAVEVADGKVNRLLDNPKGRAPDGERFMFTGVHLVSVAAIESLPESGCVIQDGYIPWLEAGKTVGAVVSDAPFFDVGTLERYLEANLRLLSGAHPWPGFSGAKNLVADSATVLGSVEGCLVGAGARVQAGVTLESCVVWPGTTVTSSLKRAIVTPSSVVQL